MSYNQNRIDLAIYGSGGLAREIAWLAHAWNQGAGVYRVVAYIDDDEARLGSTVGDVPVLSLDQLDEQHPGVDVAIGIGNPSVRRKIAERLTQRGLRSPVLVDPMVREPDRTTFGEGSVICAGTLITCDVSIGRHVHVNLDCTIGHDAVLEDYATLAPGVHVSGWVRIEEGAYVGTGASIINGREGAPLVIGAGATVGAGAVVTRDVEPGRLVVGVPAKPKGAVSGA